MTRSIGILLTNNDPSGFARRFPDDGEKYRRLLAPLRPDWDYPVIRVCDDEFPARPEAHDGYVITGSPASVNDPDPWVEHLMEFIRALDAKRIPTVGACFGHQAIAVALGGRVDKTGAWGLGVTRTHFTKLAPWMQPEHESIDLFASHQEQVLALPAGAELLGGNDFCPLGAFRIGRHVFTTAYHPEMTADFFAALLEAVHVRYVDPAGIAEARASLERPAEGALFAQWMVRFFEGG